MSGQEKKVKSALPIVWVSAFTSILVALIPSAVIAARTDNFFILSFVLPTMAIVLVLDGIVLSSVFKR